MERRDFLSTVALAAIAGDLLSTFACASPTDASLTNPDAASFEAHRRNSTSPLGARAATKGIQYGCATNTKALFRDAAFAAALSQEARVLVPEYEMKWWPTRPSPGVFDFTRPDRLVAFAVERGMEVRGHTLVWHLALPEWVTAFLGTASRDEAAGLLTNHVQTLVSHYAGLVRTWDVVNEPLTVVGGLAGLRDSPWRRAIGDDYIAISLTAAASADPSARLFLNEYDLEGDESDCALRRDAMLRLLEDLLDRGVPVHGLGIQAHLSNANASASFVAFRRFLSEIGGMGLEILVTELDVSDDLADPDVPTRDARIADTYARFVAAALDEPAVSTIVTWGLSDRYSWLNVSGARSDGLPVRPLPLDTDLIRKPAWRAMASAFDNAPERNVADATLQRIPSDREVDLPGNRAVPADL